MKRRILIADDEEIVIRSCLRILSDGDFLIDTAKNGMEAITKIHENAYDLLILDIKMPKMNGIEVLQRVKETHPDIDVIMITGLNQIETAVDRIHVLITEDTAEMLMTELTYHLRALRRRIADAPQIRDLSKEA